ncbi:MAG: hypothetical protein WA916_08720 [Arcobacter sp.]|uniref:hypothetical protein n=1 Tax=Arcobacter sp. TaxID=1872629 RepID=UPI003C7580C2
MEEKELFRHMNRLAGILTEAHILSIGFEGELKDRDLGYIYENRKGLTKEKFEETKKILINNKIKVENIIQNELNPAWSEQNKKDLLYAMNILIN